MDPTLNDLEQRLIRRASSAFPAPPSCSLSAVAEVHPMPGGSGEVRLKNGERLEVSRRRFRELLEALEGV